MFAQRSMYEDSKRGRKAWNSSIHDYKFYSSSLVGSKNSWLSTNNYTVQTSLPLLRMPFFDWNRRRGNFFIAR